MSKSISVKFQKIKEDSDESDSSLSHILYSGGVTAAPHLPSEYPSMKLK